MGATFLWMCSFGVLIGTGVDPLAFSMLAVFLMLAMGYYTAIVRFFQFPQIVRVHVCARALLFGQLAKRFHLVYMDPDPHNRQAQEARSWSTYSRGQKAEG